MLILQFGLFPCNLNALQMFFCRSDPQLPRSFLRSDPSIQCWDSAHVVAFIVALLIFVVAGIVTPALLFRKIRNGLSTQEEAHVSESKKELAIAGELTPDEKKAYVAAFEWYDADGSGAIDQEELSRILEVKTGIKASEKEIHELKDEWLGHSAGDEIHQADFLKMMAAVRPCVLNRQLCSLSRSENLASRSLSDEAAIARKRQHSDVCLSLTHNRCLVTRVCIGHCSPRLPGTR